MGGGDFAPGQEDDGRDTGCGAIGSQGGRGVASGGTGYGPYRLAVGDHLLDHRDQHRHAQVFERTGVAVAAQLDPQVFHTDLLPQPLGPKAVGVSLVHGDHVLVGHLGADPFFLAPHPAAIGPFVGADALVEELYPGSGATGLQGLDVVLHVQQPTALLAAVDDVVDRIALIAATNALEPGVVGHHLQNRPPFVGRRTSASSVEPSLTEPFSAAVRRPGRTQGHSQ